MRFPMHSTVLSADMFRRTPPKNETIMSKAAYVALRQAAIDKNKMPEFNRWLKDRKITLTD
jgi:hypothetical protein